MHFRCAHSACWVRTHLFWAGRSAACIGWRGGSARQSVGGRRLIRCRSVLAAAGHCAAARGPRPSRPQARPPVRPGPARPWIQRGCEANRFPCMLQQGLDWGDAVAYERDTKHPSTSTSEPGPRPGFRFQQTPAAEKLARGSRCTERQAQRGCNRSPSMPRGPKKHLKRLNAPSHWMLDKLGGIFVRACAGSPQPS